MVTPDPPGWREADPGPEGSRALSALFPALESGPGFAPDLLFGALAAASRALKSGTPEAGGEWRASILELPSGPLVRFLGPSEAELVLYGDLDGRFYVGTLNRGGDPRSALLLRASEDGRSLVVEGREGERVLPLAEAPPDLSWTAAPVHERPVTEPAPGCPSCGVRPGESARFCRNCGAPLVPPGPPRACRACGRELSADARFCSGCGVPAA